MYSTFNKTEHFGCQSWRHEPIDVKSEIPHFSQCFSKYYIISPLTSIHFICRRQGTHRANTFVTYKPSLEKVCNITWLNPTISAISSIDLRQSYEMTLRTLLMFRVHVSLRGLPLLLTSVISSHPRENSCVNQKQLSTYICHFSD